MDAIMLVLEGVGIVMVMRWVAGGDGLTGLLAWRKSSVAGSVSTKRVGR